MNIPVLWGLIVASLALAACQGAAPTRIEAERSPGCPAPGSAVSLVRALNRTSVGSRRYLPSEFNDERDLCVTSAGDRRLTWDVAGRVVPPTARAEYAALQAQIVPLAAGRSTRGYVNLAENVGLRSMQYEVTLAVLREEQVKVPAGDFDTFVVEDRERNLNCLAIWQAWVDKKTLLPVRTHSETLNCVTTSQSDLVASRVTLPRS